MASNEQVRIDLEAKDNASKTIDHVADSVESLEKADPEVTIGADDDATPTLEKVQTIIDELERAEPEVKVTADDDASRVLEQVADEAAAIARADHELVLKARVDAAKADLASFRADLEQTADKAADVDRRMDDIGRNKGPGLAGNAVADLTGPLGEASSAASDIAGVFDGLGDIAGSAAARVGLDAEKMAGAITGIGFAVTAAATAWAYFKQRQREAREKQEELVKGQRDFNRAIAEGDRAAAAAKFAELYEDALDAAAKFGVSAETATRFIRGQTDSLPALDAEIRRVSDSIAQHGDTMTGDNETMSSQLFYLQETRSELEKANGKYREANGTLAEQDRRLADVGKALGQASDDTDEFATSQDRVEESTRRVNAELERMRGDLDIEQSMNDFKRNVIDAMSEVGESALDQSDDVLALKQTVIDMGEQFKRNPLEIAAVVADVDAGNLAAVSRAVQSWYEQNPVIIASKLDRPGTGGGTSSGSGGVGPRSAAPEIGVINMHMPAGWRGDPLRAVHATRRRAGRLYAAG